MKLPFPSKKTAPTSPEGWVTLTSPGLKLGSTVRCRATGLTGIADHKVEMLSGTVQYAVQPKGDGVTRPDGWAMDIQYLEVLDEGISASTIQPAQTALQLGEELEDTVSGYKGIATQKVTYMNGCVVFGVQGKVKKDGTLPDLIWFDHKRLKLISAGVSQPEELSKPVEKRTGGPSTRTSSMRLA